MSGPRIGLTAQKPAQPNRCSRTRHLLFEFLIEIGFDHIGIITQMHGLWHIARAQIPVDRLRDKRRERRQCFNQRQEHMVERRISRQFITIIIALPETPSAASDIPIGHIVDKCCKSRGRRLQMTAIQTLANIAHQMIQTRANPAIERMI